MSAMPAATGPLQMVAEINRQHILAGSSRDQAVEHAIRCGQLLLAQKDALPHGTFMEWITINCDFEQSTATRYMTAAKRIATGVAISSMTSVFPSGRRKRDALPAPSTVQTPALKAPPAAAPVDPPSGEGFSIERALAILEASETGDARRRLKELRRTDRVVKLSLRRLKRAEIAQRNAQASAIAAARKLQQTA